MDDTERIKLLMIKWHEMFYEPTSTEAEVLEDITNLIQKGYTADEVAAGVKHYRDTYMYGRTRNWAHLLMSIGKVRKAGTNIMPAGVAADHYVSHFGYEGFKRLTTRLGYDPISADLANSVVHALGDGIGQEEPKYVRMKFISLYKELVDSYLSVDEQSAKQLSTSRFQLPNSKAGEDIKKLAGGKRP